MDLVWLVEDYSELTHLKSSSSNTNWMQTRGFKVYQMDEVERDLPEEDEEDSDEPESPEDEW